MKLFTPEQMNHQDLDRGFIAPPPTRSAHSTCGAPSFFDTDILIILLLAVLFFFDTPLSSLMPAPII
ncbi:MAG: hypothetical protein ACRCWY_13140 [Cellulosilyticaceae bacterium]